LTGPVADRSGQLGDGGRDGGQVDRRRIGLASAGEYQGCDGSAGGDGIAAGRRIDAGSLLERGDLERP
jgi:hypothetical protein